MSLEDFPMAFRNFTLLMAFVTGRCQWGEMNHD
jgi:hypothetical protein